MVDSAASALSSLSDSLDLRFELGFSVPARESEV